MAFRIGGTTDEDKELLDQIREVAWKRRVPVSQVIREALAWRIKIDGVRKQSPS